MVADISLEQRQIKDLFLGRLPKDTQGAFLYCTKLPFLKNSSWYLAGETALALQVGHRQSVDLDFFTPQAKFKELILERKLLNTKKWNTTLQQEGTLYGKLLNAKVSFIAYPFFQPSKKYVQCGNIRILLPEDIAAMKIIAISQRGRKRDFVDLFWFCKNVDSLRNVIFYALNRYPYQEHNIPYFLKSLTYFVDAEEDPMPELYFKATWNTVKKYFQQQVPIITKQILGLK